MNADTAVRSEIPMISACSPGLSLELVLSHAWTKTTHTPFKGETRPACGGLLGRAFGAAFDRHVEPRVQCSDCDIRNHSSESLRRSGASSCSAYFARHSDRGAAEYRGMCPTLHSAYQCAVGDLVDLSFAIDQTGPGPI